LSGWRSIPHRAVRCGSEMAKSWSCRQSREGEGEKKKTRGERGGVVVVEGKGRRVEF